MAEIFLYSSLDLREARGNLEDDLSDFLGEAGEVTGGGSGTHGWNIDLQVSDEALPGLLEKLTEFLTEWGVPPDTHFDVWEVRDGEERNTRYDVFATAEVVNWIKITLAFLADRLAADPSGWKAVKQEIQAKLIELDSR